MPQFRTQIILHNAGVNTTVGAQRTWESAEESFTSKILTGLTSTPVTVDFGSVTAPRVLQCRLVSGSDVEVSLDNGVTYPIRLSGADDITSVRLNLESFREVSTVQVDPDTAGSLAGLYFDLSDRLGPVRVWYNTTGLPEISKVTTVDDVAGSLNGKYFKFEDAAGSVAVWFDHGDLGTTEPAHGATRSIEVTGGYDDAPAADILLAIDSALTGDTAFSVVSDSIDTLTITDATVGARAPITTNTSGFTVDDFQEGMTPTVPAVPGLGRLLPVTYVRNSVVSVIAAVTAAAVGADAEFEAVSNGTDLVTITDLHVGNRADVVIGTSTFVVVTQRQGAVVTPCKVRSTGVSSVMLTVAPN